MAQLVQRVLQQGDEGFVPGQQTLGEPIQLGEAAKQLGITDPTKISLQSVSDLGGFSPVANDTTVSAGVASPPISEGTDSLHDIKKEVDSGIEELKNDTTISDTINLPNSSEELNTLTKNLTDSYAALKKTTNDDLEQIREAGQAAASQYLPAIREAMRKRQLELPKARIRAGERGGFLSTQFAGEAAVLPTLGEDFVGKGGELSEIREFLDLNVSRLIDAKNQAVAAAEAAARLSIKTGKQQDFQNAKILLDTARQANNDAYKNYSLVQGIKRNLEASQRAETELPFKIAQDELNIISKIPAGQTQTINGIEFTGIAASDVDAFWTSSAIVSLMKALPAGESRTLDDPKLGTITVTGIGTDDPNVKILQTTNDKGEVTITKYDINSGEVIDQVSAGQIGKSKTAPISLTISANQSNDLQNAINFLEGTKDPATGLYDLEQAKNQVQAFIIKNPGKRKVIMDAIRDKLPDTEEARQFITGKIEEKEEPICITKPDGTKVCF